MIFPIPKPVRDPKERKHLRARTPLRNRNPERAAKKYARNFGGEGDRMDHREFITGLPCAVLLQQRSDVEAAHVIGRGMGGARGTWRELVPLSRRLHAELDQIGVDKFDAKHGLNLWGLRHALVVADPDVDLGEKLQAWKRLEEDVPVELHRGGVLQLAWDLCGFKVEPPRCGEDLLAVEGGDA